MNAAVRPYATAGVALVGASVIAISPLAPPMPDLQAVQRSVSSVGVELSAAVNPIENWIQVFSRGPQQISVQSASRSVTVPPPRSSSRSFSTRWPPSRT